MLKNGKPYTNENGWEDKALLTTEDTQTIQAVSEWIRKNIRTSGTICEHSSYGLKHLLEEDTHIYLTNNQFKDAMLMAGFNPVDPNALNWTYRIALTSSINMNPSPFMKWARKNMSRLKGPVADFADDMLSDFGFPAFADHEIILRYLEKLGAWQPAIDAFEELWRLYEKDHPDL